MGMAASQARLLTITARLADNELRSQTINNAKMRLATQSSQASENYINALNNATMTFTNYDLQGESLSQALTFNALTAYSSYNTQYGLVNSSGQLLVSESEAAIFANCGNNLNNFLKAHGLEYKTTYFETLGGFTTKAYPEPYNNISVEDLEQWYQYYTSYENSVEIEEFQNAIENYQNAEALLNTAGNELMATYLKDTGNIPKLTFDQGSYKLNFTKAGFGDLLNEFKQAFLGTNQNSYESSDTNKYNLHFLENKGYLVDEKIIEYLTNEIQKFSNATNPVTNKPAIKVTETTSPSKFVENKDENGNVISTTYTFGDEDEPMTVTVKNGKIISYDFTAIKNVETYSKTSSDGKTTTTGTFTDNSESYKNADGSYSRLSYSTTKTVGSAAPETENYYYEFNNGKLVGYSYINETQKFKDTLNETIDIIIRKILANANFETFAEDMNSDTKYNNIILTKARNKTISEIYSTYTQSKGGFLPMIFKETDTVQTDLDNATLITMKNGDGTDATVKNLDGSTSKDIRPVNIKNLQDIEFILQYMREKNLKPADNFNTVIKEYIMNNIIEINGTPKYAWVDENDTTNTGNADAKAQWYTNLFKRMQQGYKQIEDGLASSKEWIEYALESGIVSMEQVDLNFNWRSLDYKTCSKITEVTDDAAVARAEAEYNRAMNDIKAKDNIYDLQLKNIDTEHTSLQTEYSVIEKVIQENVKRTFKFDQSA